MSAMARFAAVTVLAFCVTGCASTPPPSLVSAQSVRVEIPDRPLECVPYARAHSGLSIHGDAWTWWNKAAGRYARSATPRPGAVLVFSRKGGPPGGHVAVVRRVVSRRMIRVDHANWLGRGRIYLNDPVIDVSPDNDWSAVRVWNAETDAWGGHRYPISGFIGPASTAVASASPAS